MQRREVHYSGSVQGVGFRYTTRQVASRYDVSGFVKNLPDGRVQLVAEGERDELDRFLEAVSQAMNGYIRDAETAERDATGEFSDFGIRF